jgi:nucleotide-binding universal stress UspA family protein
MDNPVEASGGTPAAQKLAPLAVRRILAPTDMSELSGKAVVYAVRLGLALQAQVIALYVSEVFVNPTGSPVDLAEPAPRSFRKAPGETRRSWRAVR